MAGTQTISFTSAILLLLLVLDPWGNIPVVLALISDLPPARRIWVILRECFAAFIVLLLFLVFGDSFLKVMHLGQDSLRIAGAVVLFLIGIEMTFHSSSSQVKVVKEEPFLVPIAVPLIAGPSSMATLLIMRSTYAAPLYHWVSVLTLSMLIVLGIFLLASPIYKLLGDKAMKAFVHLIGLVIIVMSVQMFLQGLRTFILSLSHPM